MEDSLRAAAMIGRAQPRRPIEPPMPKSVTNSVAARRWDSEVSLLTWLATCVSVFALLFYYQRGEVLLYGDAVGHINIARRVFDSKTPGLLQLGTVWLPLPHLLMIPFLVSREMWQRGVGGSLPSMVAYVFGVIGMFRLVRGVFSRNPQPEPSAHIAAWVAAVIYAANPNLIYMQTTAMGESVYLALFIWAVVYFAESMRSDRKSLTKCGLCLAAACLTRYDAWFLAVAMMATVVVLAFLPGSHAENTVAASRPKTAARFLLLASAAPVLWLAYNGIIYRNPLEFENGPYSAKAIERKTQTPGNPGHPGTGNLLVAGMYFVKSAELNLAENAWLARGWILLALAALIAGARSFKLSCPSAERTPMWALLILLVPVPFYALSVGYGGVPIFVPPWWPFTHYNVRYGLQLLPAFAAASGVIVYFAIRSRSNTRLRASAVLGVLALAVASYASVWRAGPICLQEAQINMRTRNQLERQVADWLKHLPPQSTLLMYLGDHVGALEQAGIPLRHVINEGNHRVWKQPIDSDGLWERALANPAAYADYVVAFDGDPVWHAVQGRHLFELVEVHVTGQARAVLYRAR